MDGAVVDKDTSRFRERGGPSPSPIILDGFEKQEIGN